jgi:hypothetical protein
MLNFAEQTGSGAVIVVWSFLNKEKPEITKYYGWFIKCLVVAAAVLPVLARL